MKRSRGGFPELRPAGDSLEQQLARNTAQLRRITHFLQTVTTWNRALVRATEILARGGAPEAPRPGARIGPRQPPTELRARYDSLTPRERQVMLLVVKGLPNKQTAAELGTALVTVKIQRASVMKKMQAGSIADLVRMAEKLRLLGGA